MSNVNADGMPCWWTTSEVRIMRAVYPTQGADAAAAALPGRTRRAVCQQAQCLGLQAPRVSRAGLPRTRWVDTPELDAELQAHLPACTTTKQQRDLADRLGRPLYWLRRRAAQLGIQIERQAPRPWTRAEQSALEALAHLPAPAIALQMRRQGYRRSAGAIALRLRRLSIDRSDPDMHTTADLAELLGVRQNTVTEWIKGGGLVAARRRPDDSSIEAGQHFRVAREALRDWLRRNPTRINLARVDPVWFIDLTLGAPSI